VTVVELALYALLLAAAAVPVWRRPVAALYLFVVGLTACRRTSSTTSAATSRSCAGSSRR
jgi:hypothetical protein